MMKPAAVFCLDASSLVRATAWADTFALPLVKHRSAPPKTSKERLRIFHQHLAALPSLAFLIEADVLYLALIDKEGVRSISAGFHGATLDYRREKGGGRSEMIAKAVGLRNANQPSVIDATAGMGVDAFVLASLGCRVRMIERDSVVNALLGDGFERSSKYASEHDAGLAAILDRMQLIQGDSIERLQRIKEAERPDVVYLDPMFPERKKSAAVKKEMQIFHKLIGTDEDADLLFEAAMDVASKRVVVKRPRIAPALDGPKPSHTLEGKRNRYDIYLFP